MLKPVKIAQDLGTVVELDSGLSASDQVIDNPPEIQSYEPGSWGPDEAQSLLRGHHNWQRPWFPENNRAKH